MPTYPGWGSEGPVPQTPWAGRGGKDDSNIAHFFTTRLAVFTHLLSNVMRSKHFLSHLILPLSWCLKYKTRSRWEKLASSHNPFFRVVQIIIRATARIARNTTRFSLWNGGRKLSMTYWNVTGSGEGYAGSLGKQCFAHRLTSTLSL